MQWFLNHYRYPKGSVVPAYEPAKIQEDTFPWRYGVGTVLRIPLTRSGIVFGKYHGNLADEDEDGPLVSMRAVSWEETVRALEDDEER